MPGNGPRLLRSRLRDRPLCGCCPSRLEHTAKGEAQWRHGSRLAGTVFTSLAAGDGAQDTASETALAVAIRATGAARPQDTATL
jgi:hypothetical protein